MADDEERDETESEDQSEDTEEDAPEVIDPRDERIALLEAQLAEATANADALSQALFTSRVGATGLVVDPEALPYDGSLLHDEDALRAAIVALIQAKPYLSRMRPTGDIDQGAREEVTAPPGLMATLKEFI